MLIKIRRCSGGIAHHLRSGSLLLLLVMGFMIILASPISARKVAQPLPFDEVATTWIGLSTDELYMVRLDLRADGTGTGGYAFLDEEPRIFRISTWKYQDNRVEIEPLPPAGPPSWVGPMRGRIRGTSMRLEVAGEDWTLRFALRREAELVQRWTLLKRMMIEPEDGGHPE